MSGPPTEWEVEARSVARMSWPNFERRLEQATPRGKRALLRARFRYDRAGFLKWVLPDLFNRPWNRFHRAMFAREKTHFRQRTGRDRFYVDAAPRGIAKTTLSSREIVHDIVYGLEGYIVVCSAEKRLARSITRDIRNLFRRPPRRLAELYGPFEVLGGVDEFSVSVAGGRPIGVLARSFGTQVRGANLNGQRPTKILIDDGERPDRVRNPTQRRQWWEFLQDDIIKAGPQEGGLVVEWKGTVLHPDAVLPNLLKAPGWEGGLWKACEAWPERTDLWERCGKIFCDLTLGSADTRWRCAWAFYQANRTEMDRGARMLDDVALPLFRFYVEIWTNGLRSVLRERQNEPASAGTRFFESETFARCKVVGTTRTKGHLVDARGRTVPLSSLRISLRLDPIPGSELGAMGDEGGSGAGDYAAIACIGRDEVGYGYVLDAWLRRARDDEQLAMLWALAETWGGPNGIRASIEANGFQRLLGREFRRQREARRAAGQYAQVVDERDTSTTNKKDRIASLQAPIAAGWLQFAEHLPPLLLGQFDSSPSGDHDDGPDAVEGAWRLSGGSPVATSPTPIPVSS